MSAPEATRFGVRYGGVVKWMTLVVCVLLFVVIGNGVVDPDYSQLKRSVMIGLPLLVVILAALHTVRGYEIDSDGIHVLRPIGRHCIARGPTRIDADPNALRWALRTFGNGGFFSFSGRFRLRDYGKARVWVTDVNQCLVIHSEQGVGVVSPAAGAAFIQRAQALLNAAGPP